MTEFFVLIVNVRAGPALGHSLIHWIWRHELGVSLSSQSGDFHLTIGAVDLEAGGYIPGDGFHRTQHTEVVVVFMGLDEARRQ